LKSRANPLSSCGPPPPGRLHQLLAKSGELADDLDGTEANRAGEAQELNDVKPALAALEERDEGLRLAESGTDLGLAQSPGFALGDDERHQAAVCRGSDGVHPPIMDRNDPLHKVSLRRSLNLLHYRIADLSLVRQVRMPSGITCVS